MALAVSRSILQEAERRGKLHLTPVALIIISNHLTCAMERTREHAPVSSMLQEAVMLVYPDEYQLSKKSFSLLYRKYGILIPESEAVILALCIVDAASNGCPGHLTAAQKQLRIFWNWFAIIAMFVTMRKLWNSQHTSSYDAG